MVVTLSDVTERTITSSENPLIKRLSRLQSRRYRDASGRYLIEGSREIARAIEAGVPIRRAIVASGVLDPHTGRVIEMLDVSIERVSVPPNLFGSRLSRRGNPDGVLVEALAVSRSLEQIVLPKDPLVLVAESVEKPGNLGGMLRTADAAGVDAVIVADEATDLVNPNVIRASQGSVFAVNPVAAGIDETLEFLEAHRVQVVALTPEAPRPLWDVDLTGGTAILVGSEDKGLSTKSRKVVVQAAIPMTGAADSLNVSVAAGIALYEAVRQRTQ